MKPRHKRLILILVGLAAIGVETYPNVQQARLLERYVTHRKDEIISEIDREIKESFSPPGVRDMYF